MHSQKDILDYLKERKQEFTQKYSVSKLGIFGSFARNTQNEKSDLDIILEFTDQNINLYDTKELLKKEIRKDLHIKVDICREKALNVHFREIIFSEAIYV